MNTRLAVAGCMGYRRCRLQRSPRESCDAWAHVCVHRLRHQQRVRSRRRHDDRAGQNGCVVRVDGHVECRVASVDAAARTGDGEVTVRVAALDVPSARSATITVAQTALALTQTGCRVA